MHYKHDYQFQRLTNCIHKYVINTWTLFTHFPEELKHTSNCLNYPILMAYTKFSGLFQLYIQDEHAPKK